MKRLRLQFAATSVVLLAGPLAVPAMAAATSQPSRHPAAPGAMPAFSLIEGAKGSPNPYTPRVLKIPAGRKVALKITDHLGGCALVTVFPGLAPDGGDVRARVPVGQTRRVVIRAPKPGRYRYHCAGNMYYGIIEAR